MPADLISHKKIRLALLTPYGGSNLGDGAIQTAIIEGLRRHFPNTELTKITLNPEKTSRLHNIPAFPITGLYVSFYSETLFKPTDGLFVKFARQSKQKKEVQETQKQESTQSGSKEQKNFWSRLKKTPILGSFLEYLLKITRKFFIITHEIHHLIISYKFVKRTDAIIVSGGGQLDELWGGAWGHPYALFRWAILSKLAGKKFIVTSVGVGELNTKLGRFFTRSALALACYRSYRDVDSKNLLKSWQFTSSDPCVPDLALGLMPHKCKTKKIPENKKLIVGISPIAFGHESSWPTPLGEVYKRYVSTLISFISENLLNKFQLVFFTSSGTDRQVVNEILQNLPNKTFSSALIAPEIDNLSKLLDVVSEVDVVIASRLHSVIISHILRKPVLAISFDRKVDTHMQDIGQNEYILDIHTFSQTELLDKFNSLISNTEKIKSILAENIIESENLIREQYNKLTSIIDTEAWQK